MKIFLKLLITLSFLQACLLAQETKVNSFPILKGEYLGQKKPGMTPEVFAPGIISTGAFEHSALAFTPDGKEVYWAVVFDNDTGVLLESKMINEKWTDIKTLPFSEAKFRDICPTLSSDGNRLFFTSCRPVRKNGKIGEYHIWVVDRKANGWTEPILFAPEFGPGEDARPVFTKDGTIYFGSWREGAIEGTNIFYSKLVDGKFDKPKRLGASFNTSHVMPTYVAPDESFLIFESFHPGGLGGSDFWLSFKNTDGTWGSEINLGEPINSKANDWFGGFSPDGKYFFFVSDRNGNNDVYWVDRKIIHDLKLKTTDK